MNAVAVPGSILMIGQLMRKGFDYVGGNKGQDADNYLLLPLNNHIGCFKLKNRAVITFSCRFKVKQLVIYGILN